MSVQGITTHIDIGDTGDMILGMVHMVVTTQVTIEGIMMDTMMGIGAMDIGEEITTVVTIMDTTIIMAIIITTIELTTTILDTIVKRVEPDITVQEEVCQVFLLRKKEISVE